MSFYIVYSSPTIVLLLHFKRTKGNLWNSFLSYQFLSARLFVLCFSVCPSLCVKL
jgi:hypothetical protein